MTVQASTSRADYTGNGVTTLFTVPFYFLDPTHIKVLLTDSSVTPPSVVTLVLNSDYTVTGAGVSGGGSITATVAPTTTQRITILRNVPFTQLTHYVPNDPFPAASHENALDLLTMEVQQLQEQVGRALVIPPSDNALLAALPTSASRANLLLGFDSSGNPAVYSTPNYSTTTVVATGSTTARFLADRFADVLNVLDFGAKGDGATNDGGAFQAAINALPAGGGQINVPPKAYVLNTVPNWGTKSIHWNISTGATFSGTGVGVNKFPYMNTNGAQLAVGPFIQSQSTQVSAGSNGGIAALNVEMLQPATYVGQSVAGYFGARGSNSDARANVWAINTLTRADAGAGGTYQGIEVDVDCFSTSALMKGVSVNGIGSANPTVGFEVIRSDSTLWKMGVHVLNAITGMQVDSTPGLVTALQLGAGLGGTRGLIVGQQLANGDDGILFSRNTDTAPTGSFLRFVNAANNVQLARLDVLGNLAIAGSITAGGNATESSVSAGNIQITGGAISMPAGQICLGNTVAGTATAGSATLPANPVGFLDFFIGATVYKIPYYNN